MNRLSSFTFPPVDTSPEAVAEQRGTGRILLAAAPAMLSRDPAPALAMAGRILSAFAGDLAPTPPEYGFATAATAEGRERRAVQLYVLIAAMLANLDAYGLTLETLENAVADC